MNRIYRKTEICCGRSLEAEIVADALKDVCTASNPRVPTKQDIRRILKQLIG